ncbi:MAG: FkbM family methyltransferase, partial [Bacteroidetes bacterium]|nr:FkbM family methyltransferase [Bacteroidota bacterium]
MNWVKKAIPNNIKLAGRYYLYELLKIPFNRVGVPVELTQWLPADAPPISFIDIGASKGKFSASLTRFYAIKRAVLVEPIPEIAESLNKRFSDTEIFKVLNMAVSDQSGEAEFFFSKELDVMSSLLEIKDEFHAPFLLSTAGEKTKVKTDTL